MNMMKKLGFVPLVVIVTLGAGFMSCDQVSGFMGSGEEYKVAIDPAASGVFFASPGMAREGESVSIYSRMGKPRVVSLFNEEITVSGGAGITDAAVLDKLGLTVAYKYTFIMPSSPVVVSRSSAVGDVGNSALKLVKFEYLVRPETNESLNEGDQVYGSDERPFYADGAPVLSIRRIKVTAGLDIRVSTETVAGVEGMVYIKDGGAEQDFSGSVDLGSVPEGGEISLEIRVRTEIETVSYVYKLTTSSFASDVSTMREIKIKDNGAKSYTANAQDLAGIANAGRLSYEFPYESSSVTLRVGATEAAAIIESGGGRVVQDTDYQYTITGVGDEEPTKLIFNVVAENGQNATTYEIWLVRGKSNDNALKSLTIDALQGYGFNPDLLTYDLVSNPVFAGTNAVTITPTLSNADASLECDSGDGFNAAVNGVPLLFRLEKTGTGSDNGNEIKFKVKSQSGVERNYSVKIYRQGMGDMESEFDSVPLAAIALLPGPRPLDLITDPAKRDFDLIDQPFANNVGSVTFRLSVAMIYAVSDNIVISAKSAGGETAAVIEATGEDVELTLPLTAYGLTSPDTVLITVSGGKRFEEYTIKVYRYLSSEAELVSVMLSDVGGTVGYDMMKGAIAPISQGDNLIYDIKAPELLIANEVESITVSVVPKDPNAEVRLAGQKLVPNADGVRSGKVGITTFGLDHPNIFKLTVKAQNGNSVKEYEIKVYREVSRDSTLSFLESTHGSVASFSPTQLTYSLNEETQPLQFSDSTIAVNMTASNKNATIFVSAAASGSGAVLGNSGRYNWTLDAPKDGTIGRSVVLIEVTAQDKSKTTYMLTIFRDSYQNNNVELKEIYATVVGEEFSRMQARVYPYYDKNHPKSGYKLYSPYFAKGAGTQSISVDATGAVPKQTVTPHNATIEYNFDEGAAYWSEYLLPTPITINVLAEDGVTTADYKVTHLVLTPGLDVKRVPAAKGGEISFVPGASGVGGYEEIHDFKPKDNVTTLDADLEFLLYAPESQNVVNKRGRLLVQGGGGKAGAGAKADALEDGGKGGGGGGGGAGAVCVSDDFRFNSNSFGIRAGKGGSADGDSQAESGTGSYFGLGRTDIVNAAGGTGGYNGDHNSLGDNKRIIEPYAKIDHTSAVFGGGPDYRTDEVVRKPTEGGVGGEQRSYWNVAKGVLLLVGPELAVAVVFGLMWNLISNPPTAIAVLGVILAAATAAATTGAGAGMQAYNVGGFGGGGAAKPGEPGKYGGSEEGKGGAGGAGIISDIAGTDNFTYGKGGDGGSTPEGEISWNSADQDGKDGIGGNVEYSGGRSGGAGRVIARFKWE